MHLSPPGRSCRNLYHGLELKGALGKPLEVGPMVVLRKLDLYGLETQHRSGAPDCEDGEGGSWSWTMPGAGLGAEPTKTLLSELASGGSI